MATVFELKESNVTETPLLLFDCELASGETEHWSTHRVEAGGRSYQARVLRHDLFEICHGSDEGIDAVSKVSVTLANADSHFSQVQRREGWKGARITIRFVFFDLKSGATASADHVVFRGVANPPDEITETALRLTFTNRMNLQRLLLPEVRVQRRCPWQFPRNANERAEAAAGGSQGKYSVFYRCGYSPEETGGVGNLSAAGPFTSCDCTKEQCQQRGMYDLDAAGRPTRRFGGIGYVPPSTIVRSYGEKGTHLSATVENEARYNDFIPLVYGTAWHSPLICFARNDGNLTHIEALVGMGEIQGVLKVLVNGIEIPAGRDGVNMTATGWYNLVNAGGRTGAFNTDFRDSAGNPVGDPYGSMAVLSVVVPNRINDGRSLPRIEALVEGIKLERYDSEGNYLGESFTNNPAWVLLDVLRRSGWKAEEIDLGSFGQTAAYCDELIETRDPHGTATWIPRFQCNLVLRRRRSAADVVRGIRNGSRLRLTYGDGGRLAVRVENSLALQQPVKSPWSNSTEPLDGGWPSYEFGDGTNGFSGILRKAGGEPSIRIWSKSTAETTNRLSIEFQDALNEYQQDSLALVDIEDVLAAGQEVSGSLPALGIPNFSQAARILRHHLNKAIRGNTFVEFETSVRGLGLRPGDLITLTYLKEGYQRQPFRVLKISPGPNYRTMSITAQLHDDAWYSGSDAADGSPPAGRQAQAGIGLPRPLAGAVIDEQGRPQLEISEAPAETADGGMTVGLKVGFRAPARPVPSKAGMPVLSLAPVIAPDGGSLAGGRTFYYALSGVDDLGAESPLSFIVAAPVPSGTDTNRVTLQGLSFSAGTAAFHVYRGENPTQLFRIASFEQIAGAYTDAGLPAGLAGPPDENYDHANLYWRLELQPEVQCTIHGPASIGNSDLQMAVDEYKGQTVRIMGGRGTGQERTILSNTATTLSLSSNWDLEPDETSSFTVAEAGWHLGTSAIASPAEFEVPNRVGATVQVLGRAANVNNQECAYELSPLTRWRIGGAAGGFSDEGVPGTPVFGLSLLGKGTVEVGAIGFEDLINTRTISAATLTLYYWNELASPCTILLAAQTSEADSCLVLTRAGDAEAGGLIQCESEILLVNEIQDGGQRYGVLRGQCGTAPAAHGAATPVYRLDKKVHILPFPRDFIGSPSSGSYSFPIFLPDARIAAAEMFVTNTRGNSTVARIPLTGTMDSGLRTGSGGQFSLQYGGFLAIQSDAVPCLVVEETHAVRDIFAVVGEAPMGAPVELRLRQDEDEYCRLTIPAGAKVSNIVDGFGMAPLRSGAKLGLDILSVGQSADTTPGRDLTVTLRR